MNAFPLGRKFIFFFSLSLTSVLVATAAIYIYFGSGIAVAGLFRRFWALLQQPSAPAVFIAAMILLPPFGFPISFFLALAGLRFGIRDGMLLTFFILPVHMTICYTVTRTFLRGPLNGFLARKGYRIPLLQTRRPGLAMFGFLLMPGPPYALKTYLLAMTEIPYIRFLLFNWGTETLITLPIVAMTGAAVEKNWFLFAAALFIFALSLGLRWYRRRKSRTESLS